MQQVDELDAVSGVHDEGMRRYETKYRLGYSPSDATILEMATLQAASMKARVWKDSDMVNGV